MLQQPHHETLNSMPSSFAHEMDNKSVVSGTSSAIDEALDGRLEAFMANSLQENQVTSNNTHPLAKTATLGNKNDGEAAAILSRKKQASDDSSKDMNNSKSSVINNSSATKITNGIGIGSHTHSLIFDDNDSTMGSLIFDDSSVVEDQPLSRQQRTSLVSFAAEELAAADETATEEERRHHSDGTLEINSSAHTNASRPKVKRVRSKNPEDVPPGAKSFPVNTPRLAKFPTNEPRMSKFPKNEARMVKKTSAQKENNLSVSDPGLSNRRRGRSRPRRKEGGLDVSSKSDTAAVKKSAKTKSRMTDASDKSLDKSRRRTKMTDSSDKAVEKKKKRSQSVPAESSDHSRELLVAEQPQHQQLLEEEPEPHPVRSRNVSDPSIATLKKPHPIRSRNISDSSIALGPSSHSNIKHKQYARKRASDPDVLGSSTSNRREKRASDPDVLGSSTSNRREKRASDPDMLGSSTSNRREKRGSDPDVLGSSTSNRREKRGSDPNVLDSSSSNRRERDRSTSKRPSKTSLHALEQKKQEQLKQEEQEQRQRQELYRKDEELLVDFPDIDTHDSAADNESLIPDTPAEPPALKKSSSRMSMFSLGKKKQQTYGKLADDEDETEPVTTREYVKQLVLVEGTSSPSDSPTLSTAASFRKRAASLGVGKKRAKKPSSTNKRSASVSVRSSATKSTTSEGRRSASVSAKSRTSTDGITKKITNRGRKLVKKATSKSEAKGPPKVYFPKNEPRGGPKRRWSLTDTAVISSDIENFSGIEDDISVNKKQTALDGIASPSTSRATLDDDQPELKKTRRSSLKMDKIRARSESIKKRRRSRSKRRSESVSRDGDKYRSHTSSSLLSHNHSDDDADHSMGDSHQNLLENISISDIIGSSESSKNIMANIAKDKSLALTDRWEHIPIRSPHHDYQSADDHPGMNGSSSRQSRRRRHPDGSQSTLDASLREMVPMTPVNQIEGRRDRRLRGQGLAESSHTTRTDMTSMEGSLQALSIRETRKARRQQRLAEYSPGDHSTLDSSREISPNTQSSSQNRRGRHGVADHSPGDFSTTTGSSKDLSPAYTRATRKSRGVPVVERSPGDRFTSDGSSSKRKTSRIRDNQRRSRSASANIYHDDPEANFDGELEAPRIRKVRKARVDKNGETVRGRRTRSESTARKKTSSRQAGSSTSREHRRRGHTHDTGATRHHHSSSSIPRTRRDSTSRSRSRSKNSKSLSNSAQFRLPVEPPLHKADDPHPEVVPKMDVDLGEESDVEDHHEDAGMNRSARKKSLSIRHLYANGQVSDGEDSEAGGDFNASNTSSQEHLNSNHASNASSLNTSNSSMPNASNGSSLQSSNHSSLHMSNSSNLHESNSSSLSNNSSSLTLDNLYGLVVEKEDNGAKNAGQSSEKPAVKKKSSRKPRNSVRSTSLTPMHVSFRDNDSVQEIEDDFRSKDDLDAEQMSKSDVADRSRHRDSRRRVLEAGAMAMRDTRRGAGVSRERRHSKDRMAVSEGDHNDYHHHSKADLEDDIAALKEASRQPTKAASALYSNPQQRRRLRTNVGHEMLHASINSASTMGLEHSPPPPSLNSENRKEQVWHRRRRKSSEHEEDDDE